jgi:hypothetical protein
VTAILSSLKAGGGHGVDFFLGQHPRTGQLVAVLRGFEWLRGNPETVVIRIRPVGTDFDATRHSEACVAIEEFVRAKRPEDGQLSAGVYAHVNG